MRYQPGCTDFAPRTPSLLFINRLGRLAMEHEFEGKPRVYPQAGQAMKNRKTRPRISMPTKARPAKHAPRALNSKALLSPTAFGCFMCQLLTAASLSHNAVARCWKLCRGP